MKDLPPHACHTSAGRRWTARMSRVLACGLVLVQALISGCSGALGGDSADFPEVTSSRNVLLYLYPPSGATYPAQATDQLKVESGTVGVVPIDPGVELSTDLMIEPQPEEGTPSQGPLSASGIITALETTSQLSYTGHTDDQEIVDLRLPAGTYDMTIAWDGNGIPFPPQFLQGIEITARSANSFTLPELDPGVEFRVVLVDEEGNPLNDVWVYTLDPTTQVRSSLNLLVGNEAPGEYVLQTLHGPQQLWVGPSSTNQSLTHHFLDTIAVSEQMEPTQTWTLALSTSRLSGRVLDAIGTPLENVSVLLTRNAEGQEGAYSLTLTTGPDGTYAREVPTGDYDIVFRPLSQPTADGALLLSGTRLRNMQNSADYPLVVGDTILLEGRTVTGHVLAGDGTPVAGSEVYFSSTDRANSGQGTVTDDNGEYQVTLGLGDYAVEVTPSAGSFLTRQVVAMTITAETETLPEFRLTQGFSASYQFVIDGQPISGVLVDVREIPADNTSIWLPQYRLASALTDENGQATLVLPFDPAESREARPIP